MAPGVISAVFPSHLIASRLSAIDIFPALCASRIVGVRGCIVSAYRNERRRLAKVYTKQLGMAEVSQTKFVYKASRGRYLYDILINLSAAGFFGKKSFIARTRPRVKRRCLYESFEPTALSGFSLDNTSVTPRISDFPSRMQIWRSSRPARLQL